MSAGDGLRASVRVPGRVEAAFTSAPGEVLAVIGPNGAGKSSLVRALAGLAPAEGRAVLDGVDLLRVPARDRRVGLVFQGQMLFPHLTALANVAFGPRARGTPRGQAEGEARAWLERFGIGDLADRRPRRLSGGQAQRVAIARALAVEPDVVFADEPTGALDQATGEEVIRLLTSVTRDQGASLVMVTHDAEVAGHCDRVFHVRDGRITNHSQYTVA
jgi:molybdate transport system ATP-binding protein